MMPRTEILARLEERDLLDLAKQVAAEHTVTVAEICSSECLGREVVRARHALWRLLRQKLPSWSAVARIFGADHSTLVAAERSPDCAIVEVLLATFEAPGASYAFRWQKRGEEPYGVTDVLADETSWYANYHVARARYALLCEQAGAPSFRTAAPRVPDPPTEKAGVGGGS